MIKTLIKGIYFTFISIVLISIILAGWTSYTFISQSSKSSEITKVIKDMYSSQKTFVVDVIQLSKILIKDTSKSFSNENNNLLLETESLVDTVDPVDPVDTDNTNQLDELKFSEDKGDNPLGIVIEPSLPEASENRLPDLIEEPLVFDQNDLSMDKMEIATEVNS